VNDLPPGLFGFCAVLIAVSLFFGGALLVYAWLGH
jgi:hypothetical protein